MSVMVDIDWKEYIKKGFAIKCSLTNWTGIAY